MDMDFAATPVLIRQLFPNTLSMLERRGTEARPRASSPKPRTCRRTGAARPARKPGGHDQHNTVTLEFTLESAAALLKHRCSVIMYDGDVKEDVLCSRDPQGCVSNLRFLFTRFSEGLTEFLQERGHTFTGTMSDYSLVTGIIASWPLLTPQALAGMTEAKVLSTTTKWIADRVLFTLQCIMVCVKKAAQLAAIYQAAHRQNGPSSPKKYASALLPTTIQQPAPPASPEILSMDCDSGLGSSAWPRASQLPSPSQSDTLSTPFNPLAGSRGSAQAFVIPGGSDASRMQSTMQWMLKMYREQLEMADGALQQERWLEELNQQALSREQSAYGSSVGNYSSLPGAFEQDGRMGEGCSMELGRAQQAAWVALDQHAALNASASDDVLQTLATPPLLSGLELNEHSAVRCPAPAACSHRPQGPYAVSHRVVSCTCTPFHYC